MPVLHGLWKTLQTQTVAYNPLISHLWVLRCYNHFRPNPSLDVGATAFAGQGIRFQAFMLSERAGMAGTMALALSFCAPFTPFRLSLALLSSHSLVSSLYLYNCSYPLHSLGFVAYFYPLLVQPLLSLFHSFDEWISGAKDTAVTETVGTGRAFVFRRRGWDTSQE